MANDNNVMSTFPSNNAADSINDFWLSELTSTTYNKMLTYQNKLATSLSEAQSYLSDSSNADLKKCVISADTINRLLSRIHQTQQYALGLKSQGYYTSSVISSENQITTSYNQLTGSMFRSKAYEDDNLLVTNDFLAKSGNGIQKATYKRHASNGIIYLDSDGNAKLDYPFVLNNDLSAKDINCENLDADSVTSDNITGSVINCNTIASSNGSTSKSYTASDSVNSPQYNISGTHNSTVKAIYQNVIWADKSDNGWSDDGSKRAVSFGLYNTNEGRKSYILFKDKINGDDNSSQLMKILLHGRTVFQSDYRELSRNDTSGSTTVKYYYYVDSASSNTTQGTTPHVVIGNNHVVRIGNKKSRIILGDMSNVVNTDLPYKLGSTSGSYGNFSYLTICGSTEFLGNLYSQKSMYIHALYPDEIRIGDNKLYEASDGSIFISNIGIESNEGQAGLRMNFAIGADGCDGGHGYALIGSAGDTTKVGLIQTTSTGRLNVNGLWGAAENLFTNKEFVPTTSSDARLKKNIQPSDVNAIDVISNLSMRQFDWKDGSGHVGVGLVVQEAAQVYKDLQLGEEDAVLDDGTQEYMAIDQYTLSMLNTKAIQELISKVNALEAEIAKLK